MAFVPFTSLIIYMLIALGCVLITARYLMLGIAGLLLILIPIEVLIMWGNIALS